MAFRLKLVPEVTHWDFFKHARYTFGLSVFLVIASIIVTMVMGLNFGIDFKGGTTIRTESTQAVDVGEYRAALAQLDLGDVSITEVFDPAFGANKHVAMVRIQAQADAEAITPEVVNQVEAALQTVDPSMTFPSVESVGPKVSGELIKTALLSVLAATAAIVVYVWLRFE